MSYNPLPQPADVIVISAGSSVTDVNRFPVGIGSTGFVSLKQGSTPISFSNPLPVSLGSSNITITGDVNVGTSVSVTSTPENPVHNHITEVGTSVENDSSVIMTINHQSFTYFYNGSNWFLI